MMPLTWVGDLDITLFKFHPKMFSGVFWHLNIHYRLQFFSLGIFLFIYLFMYLFLAALGSSLLHAGFL